MRTLDECKAEVFRRSEKIIKQRKVVRRCVIAACVPVCLVIGVWATMILPAMMPASAENDAMADSAMIESATILEYPEKHIETTPTGKSVTVVVEGVGYSVSGEDAIAAAEFLQELEYNPAKVCKCLPQFRVVTQDGSYGIHLNEGYARCEEGQASLTQEQIDILRALVLSAVPDWTPSRKIS